MLILDYTLFNHTINDANYYSNAHSKKTRSVGKNNKTANNQANSQATTTNTTQSGIGQNSNSGQCIINNNFLADHDLENKDHKRGIENQANTINTYELIKHRNDRSTQNEKDKEPCKICCHTFLSENIILKSRFALNKILNIIFIILVKI